MEKLLKLIAKTANFFHWLFKAKKSGLERTPKDERDLHTGIFGWGDYTPKHKVWVIPTIDVKDQKGFNTCQWNATIVQKEIDEGMKLSVRKLVTWAKKNGYVSGNGFSNLKSGQIALQKYGAEPYQEGEDDITDWDTYSNATLDYEEASKHKISSYWSVNSKNDALKLLDGNRALTMGIDWYSGFNQSGGFSWPWLIWKVIGWLVGGHATLIIGYEMGYRTKNVFIVQNSYSKLWGDTRTFVLDDGREITLSGIFYIDMDYFFKDNYGMWTNLDIEVDVGKFLRDYDGMNVKCKESPTIYRIQAGKKKPYLHEMDYFVYNINDPLMKSFEVVDKEILDKVETGDNMDLKKSLYWPALQHLDSPLNLTRVIEAIKSSQMPNL